MSSFQFEGRRIAYTVHGDGPQVTVLIHGLLFNQRLYRPLARELATRGHRVITIDLLGHGKSDRPTDTQEYTMPAFARQVVGLLDHLGIDKAVVGGLSLGANTTLEVAALAPERLQGMLIEMPVLDNALVGCALAFTPVMLLMTKGRPLMKALQFGARRVPYVPWFGDQLLDLVRQDPEPSGAVLQGLFFARIAPPSDVRRTFEAPTLIIGHHADPVHPFVDSGALHEELEHSRLLEASSILELRIKPERLTQEVATFLDTCWESAVATRSRRTARVA